MNDLERIKTINLWVARAVAAVLMLCFYGIASILETLFSADKAVVLLCLLIYIVVFFRVDGAGRMVTMFLEKHQIQIDRTQSSKLRNIEE